VTALLAVLLAVLAVLLGVPRPPGRRLRARLTEPSAPVRRGRARRVARVGLAVLAAAALVGLGLVTGGPAGAVLAAALVVALGTAVGLARGHLRRRAARRAQDDVAHACAVLASYVRVGQVATDALVRAAEDCPVLAPAARTQQIGGDVPAAWQAQATGPGRGGLAELARAWQVSMRTGAPLSASVEQVAAGLTADQSLRAVVAGELSAPRATGKVMAVLPLLGIGLGYALGGRPLTWLLAGPVGWACLLGGVLLAAAGVTWIERLARAADGGG
jgi:tight adherence protein B